MTDDKHEERILRQMQETRASLTEKLEILEQKVVGTVENATCAVNETVGAIKDTVHETASTVNETVKDSVDAVKDLFDVPAHVEQHPWLMVGGSVAVGYVLGTMVTPKGKSSYSGSPSASYAAPTPSYASTPARAPAATEGLFASEISKVKKLALGMLLGSAREFLASAVPGHLGEQVKQVVDSVTEKLGGEPLPASDVSSLRDAVYPKSEQSEEPEAETGQKRSTGTGNGHSAARRW